MQRVMLRRKQMVLWLTAVGALFAVALGLFFTIGGQSGAEDAMAKRIELTVIDNEDVGELRDWAQRFCRGWTVKSLAADLGVDARMDVVTGAVAKGLPSESRRVVVEVCERELNRSTKGAPRSPSSWAGNASIKPEETKLLATQSFDEFGNPLQTGLLQGGSGEYGWLGIQSRRAQLPSLSVIQMGKRS
jgi:hypothetical protein